jgi:hypothetical protein
MPTVLADALGIVDAAQQVAAARYSIQGLDLQEEVEERVVAPHSGSVPHPTHGVRLRREVESEALRVQPLTPDPRHPVHDLQPLVHEPARPIPEPVRPLHDPGGACPTPCLACWSLCGPCRTLCGAFWSPSGSCSTFSRCRTPQSMHKRRLGRITFCGLGLGAMLPRSQDLARLILTHFYLSREWIIAENLHSGNKGLDKSWAWSTGCAPGVCARLRALRVL